MRLGLTYNNETNLLFLVIGWRFSARVRELSIFALHGSQSACIAWISAQSKPWLVFAAIELFLNVKNIPHDCF